MSLIIERTFLNRGVVCRESLTVGLKEGGERRRTRPQEEATATPRGAAVARAIS